MLAKQLVKAGREYKTLRRMVPLGVIRSKTEYDRAVAALDAIIDEIGEDEAHPLAELAEALSVFVEAYEEKSDLHGIAKCRKEKSIPFPEMKKRLGLAG